MWTRARTMYAMSLRSMVHRLRHDIAREVVLAISSLVLFATFAYVLGDFVNVQIASLSRGMRETFAAVLSGLLIIVAWAGATTVMRRARWGQRSLTHFAIVQGEEPRVLGLYLALHGATVMALLHGSAWWISQRWLYRLDSKSLALTEGLMMILCAVISLVAPKAPRRQPSQDYRGRWAWLGPLAEGVSGSDSPNEYSLRNRLAPHAPGSGPTGKIQALSRWRLSQILTRHPVSRLGLLGALGLAIPAVVAGWSRAPLFVGGAAALASGLVGALGLLFFAAEDIKEAWTERHAGITHDQYVAAYERISWLLGGGLAVIIGLLYAQGRLMSGPGTWSMALGEGATVAALASLPMVVTPWILFQIDVRHPGINAVIVFMASLFVGTAILAHGLSLLLVPVLRYYALQSQRGRFYRA